MNPKTMLRSLAFAAVLPFAGSVPMARAQVPITPVSGTAARPTIVLVHGAFADGGSWSGVARTLAARGYPVLTVANPLRGVAPDAAYTSSVVRALKGPVVLVGHSYGGMVISQVAEANPDVRALVYVAALAPDTGETVAGLAGKFAGSTLAAALADPVALPDGVQDLYVRQDRFRQQFAADVAPQTAAALAAAQRPVAAAALDEAASGAAWKHVPSYFVYGTADRNLPLEALRFMARRARAKDIVEVAGASHVVMVSHPDAVAKLIEKAAGGR